MESKNVKDIRDSQAKRSIARDLHYFKKLLVNFKENISMEQAKDEVLKNYRH